MKIMIATPMYGGNCKGVYTEGLLQLVMGLSAKGHQTYFSKIYNESLITRARNNLVHEFYKTDADALLFIDSDQGFKAGDIIKMIESGKDLIGAIYPMKNINWDTVRMAVEAGKEDLSKYTGFFSANLLKERQTNVDLNEPLEVENVATGMMFITRKVFDTLKPNCNTYGINGPTGAIDLNTRVAEFFATEIDERGILLSEDYYFCRKWREAGGTVYAAPWVDITHFGEYNFSGNFALTAIMKTELENKQIK